MGAVVLTYDHVLERSVALKRTSRAGSDDLLRFKREFRAIEALVHPNLVRLYELGLDDEGFYYTMEAIDGVDLAVHCAAGDRVARLSAAVPQLAAALAFLHRRGVVHCDLKPSNVLVSAGGVVKLLDFGVLAELSDDPRDAVIAGTPGYMAPERIRGAAASPATDAYALGCTMYEVLTGHAPFTGSARAVLDAHLAAPAPAPSALAAGVPAALDAMCAALLSKRPADRPTLAEVARAFDASGGVVQHVDEARAAFEADPGGALIDRELIGRELIGREACTRQLAAALDGEAKLVVLSGPSGVGKTALLEWLGEDAESRGRIVLRSGARATERLAYNALDAAIDDLARHLMRPDAAGAPARHSRLAAEAFPVFRARSRVVDQARERVRQALFGFRDDLEGAPRRHVFDAVARLVDHLGAQQEVLLIVDDLQWADEDSVALLAHLLEQTTASLRVVTVFRSDVDAAAIQERLLVERNAVRIEVPPLAPEDLRALVRRTAERLGAAVSDDAVRDASSACEGRPFLAQVAGRWLARGSRGTLSDSLEAVWEAHAELLALLVAFGGWSSVPMLAAVLGRPLRAVDADLGRLTTDGLVRRSGRAEGRADLYHHLVRAAVLTRLSDEGRADAHDKIAEHLLSRPDAPKEVLVTHLSAAGRHAEAASHAISAARAAERQCAFGLAADMYAVALAQRPSDRALREARTWALERSSRYADAAAEWAELGRAAPPERRLDLALHEAHALIAASRAAEGVRRLDQALEGGAVRARGLRAVSTVARFLIGPTGRRRAAVVSPALGARAERNLKIAILLAFLDPVTGLRFLQRARADFLRTGADAQVAGCDYMCSILAYAGARDPDRVPLAERYLAAADLRCEGLRLPPEVEGMPAFVEGLREMRRGRWVSARRGFEAAADRFRESTGTTELTMVRSWLMMMAAHMQDMPEARRHRDWFRRSSEECGGTILVAHLGLCDGYIQLLEGRFDEGFATLTRTADGFDDEPPNAQRAALLLYRHAAMLYRADPARLRRDVADAFARARKFRFMSSMYAGTYGTIQVLVEANALRVGDRGASARRLERIARIVDAAPPLWAGGSWRARAYAADAAGRPERAIAHLERAEDEAARFSRLPDAAIARWQRGRRLGGDEGAALCADAVAVVTSLGVSPALLEEDAGLR